MSENNSNNSQVNKVDIAVLSTKIDGMEKTLDKIQNNELVHIKQAVEDCHDKINNIEKKIAYYIGGFAFLGIAFQVIMAVWGKF